MASIRDSVLDQYGNAISGALVILFTYPTGSEVARMTTGSLGVFEFNNLVVGQYKLQISGTNLTTRIIQPIQAVDPYPLASPSASGLMAASDKSKLDGLPAQVKISTATDYYPHTPGDGDLLCWVQTASLWSTVPRLSLPFVQLASQTLGGGTAQYAGMSPKLNGNGLLDYSFLNVTGVGGQAQFAGRLPVMDSAGYLDTSLFRASAVGGSGFAGWLVKLSGGGLIDNSLLNLASVGGSSSANKIPKLNSSGRVDPSMLPTTGGVYRGSIDLTAAYVNPGWTDGDYGSTSKAGAVHSSWNAYLNDPVPTSVKVGDQVYYTGGKYSVVPATTDLSAYLLRDGSQPMTGPLTLTVQNAGNQPTSDQALSRAGGDLLYLRRHIGSLSSVTQLTNKNTAVALNAIEGRVVMAAGDLLPAAMAGPRPAAFTLSNSVIQPSATVLVQHYSGGTLGAYRCWTGAPLAGSCTVYVENITGAALNQVITLQFQVLIGP